VGVTDRFHATRENTSAVVAARAGDRRALDGLVAEHLPLVYSIVRRTLSSNVDVDDVVQETMLRVVRGIGGLRQPDRFRSWLVAITLNQIREHFGRRHTTATSLEEYDDHPDPGSEFVDRTLTRLAVLQQRREIEPAARWLGREDRELLSLWSLERGGHLTRAEITRAVGQDAHHVTVRISRLKNRLDAARTLTRALTTGPRCPEFRQLTSDWPGEPSPLWRKRFLRHVTRCRSCRTTGSDLLPVERLLLGVALLALPAGYTLRVLSGVHSAVQRSAVVLESGRQADSGTHPLGLRRRITDFLAAKPAHVVVGLTAACVLGVAAVVLTNPPERETTAALVNTELAVSPPRTTVSSVAPTTTAPVTSRPAATSRPPTPPRPPATSATAPATGATPSTRQPAADPRPARLITLLNERRRALGLVEVQVSSDHERAANDCVQQNLRAGTFQHCGYEVLYKGGGGASPERIVDAWFNSEGHRHALTHPTSRNAGAAIAVNPEGTVLLAAINIDY
jgi:RNA polymerase sigma factor (sigma-70 family)